MKKLIVFLPLALAACVDAGTPMVSDYNGKVVKVQFHNVPLGDNYRESPIYHKAVETCRLDGRNEAAYQGMRRVSEYAGEHVFLCM